MLVWGAWWDGDAGRGERQASEVRNVENTRAASCRGWGGGSEDSAAMFLSVGAGRHPACAVQPGL